MKRLSIGDQLKQVAGVVQGAATQMAAGAVKSWMVDHRAELMEVIQQAQTERGAALLHELCRKVPIVAGFVSMAMNGSPDMAIAAIGSFDRGLGDQLKQHRANVVKLQEYWRLGAAQQQRKENT